jgi:hypothetical protein
MKTAVEWLIDELGLDCTTDYEDEIHEALEMEKEKYKYFFECGRNYQLTGEGTFKELYNETFKQQEQ